MKKKKIAVLRANALGDFIFVLPALQVLRKRFPEAEIFYLGKPMHKLLLDSRPGPVDKVIVIPPYPGVGEAEDFKPNPKEMDAFFTHMRAEKFDMAFQMHGGGFHSNPFVLQLDARLTIGLGTPDAVPLDITVPYITFFNETLRYIELVSYLTSDRFEKYNLAVTKKDIQDACNISGCDNLNKPLVVVNPGAMDIRRRWPEERFAKIIDFLTKGGWQVYLNGMIGEEDIIEKIMARLPDTSCVRNLCGKVPLPALIGLISMSDLVLSNDTGPLHLAHILHIPSVGIYWVGNLITGSPLSSAYIYPLISWTTTCPVCGLETRKFETVDNGCTHNTSFVAEIDESEVRKAIGNLLPPKNEALPRSKHAGLNRNGY